MHRAWLVWAVTTVGVIAALGIAPRAMGAGGATLGPGASIVPVDVDGNGLYDFLNVTVTATTVANGDFVINAFLLTGTGERVQQVVIPLPYVAGTSTETMAFLGPTIRQGDVDGPYLVNLTLQEQSRFAVTALAHLNVTTAAYRAAQFEPFWVSVSGPITTQATGPDRNGLFDALVAHIPLRANRTTTVDVLAALDAPSLTFAGPIDDGSGDRVVRAGDSVWNASFPGMTLYARGYDGPYSLAVSLYLPGYPSPLAQTGTRTASYNHTAFERTSAEPRATGVTSEILPAGTIGGANALQVRVPIEVRAAGNYTLSAQLEGLLAVHSTHLDPGDTAIFLNYSGIQVNRLASDAPWSLALTLARTDGSPWDWIQRTTSVVGFNRSAFTRRPAAWLNVTLLAPGTEPPFASEALVMDLSSHFWLTVYQAGFQDAFDLELYPGNFTVLLVAPSFYGYASSSAAMRVTLAGDRDLQLTLSPDPQAAVATDIRFVNWTTATVRTTVVQTGGQAAWTRALADLQGNSDGVATPAELALALQSPTLPSASSIQVDREAWSEAYHGLAATPQGAGPVLENATIQVTSTTVIRGSADVGPQHTVELDTPYGTASAPNAVGIALPGGWNGTLALPPNVTATPTGAGSWHLALGAAPFPNGAWAAVTIMATEFPPPAPDPVVLAWLAAIAATVIGTAFGGHPVRRRRKRTRGSGPS